MVIKNRFLIRLAGWLAAQLVRLWFCTLRLHVEFVEPLTDPRGEGKRGWLFSMWHEDMLALGYFGRGQGIHVLISRSRDGELISSAVETLGFRTVRGSTNRGGASAAREILNDLGGASAAITPDGPRGPRRTLQGGAVFLSSRSEMPLVPVGVAYERPWRLSSWDKLAIPRPFSRVVICLGEPLSLDKNAGQDELERQRLKMAERMHVSVQRAETLMRNWRTGKPLPLVSPEAKAAEVPLRKSA